MSEEMRERYYGKNANSETEVGSKAVKGGAVGGALGATTGAITAASTFLAIPGLGLVIAGLLTAGIAGAGAGGVTVRLVGALIRWAQEIQLHKKTLPVSNFKCHPIVSNSCIDIAIRQLTFNRYHDV